MGSPGKGPIDNENTLINIRLKLLKEKTIMELQDETLDDIYLYLMTFNFFVVKLLFATL